MAKAEKTRQYIVEKAASLFNSKGFAGTSMDDIVKATGLSKGGVYGNFSSKEAIALSAFEHAVQRVSRKCGNAPGASVLYLDKLRAVVYFYKERILDPPIEGAARSRIRRSTPTTATRPAQPRHRRPGRLAATNRLHPGKGKGAGRSAALRRQPGLRRPVHRHPGRRYHAGSSTRTCATSTPWLNSCWI
ncbi:MAG: TetR/AcrR family transcriptional regulator [Lewinellaceae bacterium]|nr:TetR/AcrR family transcriptional regulator [Lewinellaceae bacterium]